MTFTLVNDLISTYHPPCVRWVRFQFLDNFPLYYFLVERTEKTRSVHLHEQPRISRRGEQEPVPCAHRSAQGSRRQITRKWMLSCHQKSWRRRKPTTRYFCKRRHSTSNCEKPMPVKHTAAEAETASPTQKASPKSWKKIGIFDDSFWLLGFKKWKRSNVTTSQYGERERECERELIVISAHQNEERFYSSFSKKRTENRNKSWSSWISTYHMQTMDEWKWRRN